MAKRIIRLIKVKNTLSTKVLQNVKIHQNKTSIKKKTLSRLRKTKITSTTEILHNKHKIYLQRKNLERNRNQINNEERQDVHQWPKETLTIIGDSMVPALKEELSNKKHQVKVRCCRGATVEDMFDYTKPILKWKTNYLSANCNYTEVYDDTSDLDILKDLRCKKLNRILIGHLNNSLRNI